MSSEMIEARDIGSRCKPFGWALYALMEAVIAITVVARLIPGVHWLTDIVGKRTKSIVQDILTNSPTHPHGIKAWLTSGLVGRVQEISSTD